MSGIRSQVLSSILCLVLLTTEPCLVVGRIWAAEKPPAVVQHDYEVLELYLKPDEALKLCFPSAQRFEAEEVRLTEEQRERIARLSDHPLWEEAFTVYQALADGRLDGYAIVTEEIGRFHDITFLVAVAPDGKVKRVEILVYRESRGGEVRYRRFLHQYEGKSLRDPIRLNRDILNITGATLSVRAISRGVRKVLGVIREAYGIK